MSYHNRFVRWVSTDRIDVTLAWLGIVVSLFLLGLRLLAEQVFLVVIPLSIGTACSLYVLVQRRYERPTVSALLPGRIADLLPALVFVGLAELVHLVNAVGERTLLVYLLTGALAALVFGQTLLTDDDHLATGPVLLQILLVSVVIRLSALHVTPGFVGVDIWTHVPVFIQGVVDQGSLAALGDSKYVMAPLYHSFGAAAALVFGDARIGLYLTLGLLQPLSALFVYASANLLVSDRWALLATALYAFSDQFIRWGLHIIPTSLGLVFFLAALYCLTRLFVVGDALSVPLLLATSLATVFTHQVSTAVVLVTLGVATAVAVAHRLLATSRSVREPPVLALASVFVVDLVVTLVSWANTPWSGGSVFLWRMLEILEASFLEGAGFLNLASRGGTEVVTAGGTGPLSGVLPFVELFGFALLLAATVVGGLRMLGWDRPVDVTFTYLLLAATMFVVVFGLSLFGVRALLPGRWLAFMYVPMAIVGAVGLATVGLRAPRGVLVAVVVIVAVGYPGTMVTAEKATLDSPALENEYPRFSYTAPEIGAVETIREIRSPAIDEIVYTDHPYQTLFDRLGGYRGEPLVVNEEGAVSTGPVVYRTYQSSGPVEFELSADSETAPANPGAETSVCRPERNVVYANDQVELCTQSVVAPV